MSVQKRLLSALAVSLISAAACERAPTAATASSPNAPSLATNTSVVCKSASVPAGYVILSYGQHYTCGFPYNGYATSMTIGLPDSPESVCNSSPIPAGWVITAMGRRYDCDSYSPSSSSYKNTNTIEIPTDTYEYVCDASTIPSTYTTTSYRYYTSSCDRYGNGSSSWPNAREIRKL